MWKLQFPAPLSLPQWSEVSALSCSLLYNFSAGESPFEDTVAVWKLADLKGCRMKLNALNVLAISTAITLFAVGRAGPAEIQQRRKAQAAAGERIKQEARQKLQRARKRAAGS